MQTDVIILGGGPAGAAAAGLLSRLGAGVTVLTRAARWSIGESIPPSTARLFAELGLVDAIDGAGFLRSRGNTVWWGSAPERVEPFPADAQGWQVERSQFDEVLLRAAETAEPRCIATPWLRRSSSGDAHHAVTWRTGGSADRRTSAPWVLDCTGRAGVLARRLGREGRPGSSHVRIARSLGGGTLGRA